MVGSAGQVFERTNRMPGNMVTGKPMYQIEPGLELSCTVSGFGSIGQMWVCVTASCGIDEGVGWACTRVR